MRGRSKSMCASSSKLYEAESNASEDDEYQTEAETSLSVEHNMNIIRKVWQQIPKIDTLPFDRRIEQIDWDQIADDTYTPQKAKQQFVNVIAPERKYRILSEILKDLEKRILSEVNLPKKPLSAISIFAEENKNLIKTKIGQNIKPGSFIKVASEEFKHLSEQEKERYRLKSNQMKKEYKDIVAKFNLEDKFSKQQKVPKTRIDNPATYYHNQLKSQGSTINFQEARKLFNDLSKKEKLSLILKFLGVKKGEKLNLNQYKKAKEVLSKDDMAMIDDYEGKPKTMSAYNAFMKDFLASNRTSSGLQWSEFFKAGVEQWRLLSAEEKHHYENASAKRKIKFKEEYDEYLASLPPDRREYETSKNKGKHKNVKDDSQKTHEANGSLNHSKATPKKRKGKKSITATENVKSQPAVSPDKLKRRGQKEKPIYCKDETDAYVPEENLQKKKKRKLSKKLVKDEQNVNNETSPVKLQSKTTSSKQEEKKKKNKVTENSAEDDHNLSSEITPVKKQSKSNSSKQEKEKTKKLKMSKTDAQDGQNLGNETCERQTEARNNIFIEEIKQELQKKKKRKKSSISEDNRNWSNETPQENKKPKTSSFIEQTKQDEVKISKKTIECPKKPPSSLRKFYASKIFKGPSSQAKIYFDSLSQQEIKTLTAKYERAKKQYVQEFENFLKSLSKKELLNFQKHGFPSVEDSSEDSDGSDSSDDSDSSD